MDDQRIADALPSWTEEVRRYLGSRTRTRRDASDLAQEAAARLLRERARGRAPVEPRAWLFRVARNLAVDQGRRVSPRPIDGEWLHVLADARDEGADDEPEFLLDGQLVSRDRLLHLLPRALADLSERDRDWLLSYYRDGRSMADIAADAGLTPNAVKSGLHRARRRLAVALTVRFLRERALRRMRRARMVR